MTIVLESTTKTVTVNGVPARIWEGRTINSQIPVICFITRIAVKDDGVADHSQFETELQDQKAPSAKAEAWPLRLIL
ncbi:MAG: hypothetical protein NVSMB64_20030 [Candidatus Velthaea sp.]